MTALRVVVMGVSAAGKSTIGAGLAERLGVTFVDADSLHPASNVAKMSAGIPLDDNDRQPWLDAVGDTLRAANSGLVMACSALKRSYRDRIRASASDTVFILLHGTREVLEQRALARSGHFMPPSLLASQLATLEELARWECGFSIDVDAAPTEIIDAAISRLEV